MAYQETCLEERTENQKLLAKLARNHKAKTRLILTGVSLVLLLALIGISWFSGRSSAKERYLSQIDDLKAEIATLKAESIVVNPVSPRIVMQILESQTGQISELATMEYLFTNAAAFSDSKQIKNWDIPFTEKSFLLKWDGIIKAGIKLDQLTVEVSEESKKIIITLPKAEILSYETDDDSVEVHDEKNNIFNPISVSDKVEYDAKTKDAMKQRAIENGLLEKAQENAEEIIKQLLSANPDIQSTYTIEFLTTN